MAKRQEQEKMEPAAEQQPVLINGVQGFVDFEGPLFALGLPPIIPVAAIVEGNRVPWPTVDRDESLRESPIELMAQFSTPGASEFSVGRFIIFIQDLALLEDTEAYEKFKSMAESVGGDTMETVLVKAVESAGGVELFASQLKKLYS